MQLGQQKLKDFLQIVIEALTQRTNMDSCRIRIAWHTQKRTGVPKKKPRAEQIMRLATFAEGLQLSPVEIMMRIPLYILGAPCIQASYIQASENTHSSCYTEGFGCSFVGFIKS